MKKLNVKKQKLLDDEDLCRHYLEYIIKHNQLSYDDILDKMLDVIDRLDKKSVNKCKQSLHQWILDVPAWYATWSQLTYVQQYEKIDPYDSKLGKLIPLTTLFKDIYPAVFMINGTRHRWYKFFQTGFESNPPVLPLFYINNVGYEGKYSRGEPLFNIERLEPRKVKMNTMIDTADTTMIPARIHFDSLEAYVLSTEKTFLSGEGINNPTYRAKIERNLSASKTLLNYILGEGYAPDDRGYITIPQHYSRHPWGRLYNKSNIIQLQNLPKELREAAFGGMVSIDLNTAAFAWYKSMAVDLGIDVPLSLDHMLENKNQWRKTVAKKTFETNDDWAVKIVKTATTAIGFGARATENYTALEDIILSKSKRDTFLATDEVRELIELRNSVRDNVKADKQMIDYIRDTMPECLTPTGRISMPKVMAMLYQRTESEIIQDLTEALAKEGIKTHLNLHDGIYVDSKFIADGYGWLLEDTLKKHSKYYTASYEKLKRWRNENTLLRQQQEAEADLHRQRMLREEQRAQTYVPVFATTNKTDPVKQKSQAENNTKTLELHLARYQTFDDDYKDEHSFNDYLFEKTGLRISY